MHKQLAMVWSIRLSALKRLVVLLGHFIVDGHALTPLHAFMFQDFERLLIAMLLHMHGCRYVPVRVAGTEVPPQLVGLLL